MAEINDWDIAAANNNDTPPDGWPETTMQYSEVNDSAREGMAVIARYFKDINGSLVAGGAADAYTLTLNAGYAAYFDGLYVACRINATNTGATTLNVNAIGVQSVVNRDGSALTAGTLQSGGVYEFRYDGTNFQLMGTVAGATVSVGGVRLTTDINTATPPTTEAVTGVYEIYDAEGVDPLANVGFLGTNVLRVRNLMHGGPVHLEAEQADGTLVSIIEADPDGNLNIFHPVGEVERIRTQVAGKIAIVSDGNTDAEDRRITFEQQDGSNRGHIGYTGDDVMALANQIHGGNVEITAEDSVGSLRTPFQSDPDGDTFLRADQAVQIEVNGTENAIFCSQNGAVTLYYDNQSNFRTADESAADIGMGAEVRHITDSFYPVGMNVVPEDNSLDSANQTLSQNQVGFMMTYNTGTARTLQFNNAPNIKVGAMWALTVGPSGGTLTGDGGTGVQIRWWNGAGWTTTAAAGNITIGVGQYSIWKETDTLYWITGPNLS